MNLGVNHLEQGVDKKLYQLIFLFTNKVINYTNVNLPEIKHRMQFVLKKIIEVGKHIGELAITVTLRLSAAARI